MPSYECFFLWCVKIVTISTVSSRQQERYMLRVSDNPTDIQNPEPAQIFPIIRFHSTCPSFPHHLPPPSRGQAFWTNPSFGPISLSPSPGPRPQRCQLLHRCHSSQTARGLPGGGSSCHRHSILDPEGACRASLKPYEYNHAPTGCNGFQIVQWPPRINAFILGCTSTATHHAIFIAVLGWEKTLLIDSALTYTIPPKHRWSSKGILIFLAKRYTNPLLYWLWLFLFLSQPPCLHHELHHIQLLRVGHCSGHPCVSSGQSRCQKMPLLYRHSSCESYFKKASGIP